MVTLVNSVGWAGGPAAVQSILAISPPIGQFSLVGQAHPANSQSSAALPARERDSRRGRYTRYPAPSSIATWLRNLGGGKRQDHITPKFRAQGEPGHRLSWW
jgi:hypothetical protein